MVRIAKPESFMLLSPNRDQVGRQAAVEAIPLVMEPKSAYYKGPMVVLDFTSLYPSVMCAYNYCYSTCLGRVRHTDRSPNLGVTDYDIPPGLLAAVKDEVTISPNGFMFVKENVRKSLLAKMLAELLETRVMVKASMRGQEEDMPLTRLLNARQLALKFIANVSVWLPHRWPLVRGAKLKFMLPAGYVRVHDRDCVWANADGRARRRDCLDRARDSRACKFVTLLNQFANSDVA